MSVSPSFYLELLSITIWVSNIYIYLFFWGYFFSFFYQGCMRENLLVVFTSLGARDSGEGIRIPVQLTSSILDFKLVR